jgi:hypothetical protein
MTVHAIIGEFASLAKLPEFSLSELGVARIRLDDAVDIDFEYDAVNNVLHLYSEIARASENCIPEYELLLGANLFLKESVGTTIGLDLETRQFISCTQLDPDFLDGKELIVQVEKMAVAVVNFRKKLKSLDSIPLRTSKKNSRFSENVRLLSL